LRFLILGLRAKSSHDDPPWGEVSFATDGMRTAELSLYRFVKDARADVVAPFRDSQNPVKVYSAGRCRYRTLSLADFAAELRAPDKATLQSIRNADGVATFQYVDRDLVTEMEVDKKTAITRRLARLFKGELQSEVYQAGELRCSGDIVFPAVVVRAGYVAGRLASAEVLSPISIGVNRPLPEDTFKVAQHKGSSVLDFRRSKDGHWVTITEDVPDVVAYLQSADKMRGTVSATTEVPWGEWKNDWSVYLTTAKSVWAMDDLPVFRIDLRKREESDELSSSLHGWILEVDKRRFEIWQDPGDDSTAAKRKQAVQPGTVVEAYATFGFYRDEHAGGGMGGRATCLYTRRAKQDVWIAKYSLLPLTKEGAIDAQAGRDGLFQWTPGKHVVRVAFPTNPLADSEEKRAYAFSNPVEVQVQRAKTP
jgi:hypothetical protein